MKYHLSLLVFLLISTLSFGQFKVIKFGIKGGVNYPQNALSTDDILSIYNDQTYDITNLQTDFQNGFHFGGITRISLPLVPVYVHGEALYTQFKETLVITDGGQEVDLSSTVRRLDFPISAGAKFGPAFAGLGVTPSLPFADASALWSSDQEANLTWGWHIQAGLKLWRLMGEVKYEGGFGMLSRNVTYTDNGGTDYNFDLDARRSQIMVSLTYFFK